MRTIIVIFGLLCAVGARGQIYINSYAFGAAPAAGLLLDNYPNAAAAYSLRHLRSLYTGNCIQVRRASDNALQDIGFSGGVLDTAALKTHCAGTDCFVTIWYDQAGGGFNATQATNANQPRIVSGGVVDRLNGQPSARFDGTDRMVSATLGNYLGVITAFAVFNTITGSGTVNYIYDLGNVRYILYTDVSIWRIYMQVDLVGPTRVLNQQYLTYALYNLTSSEFKLNNLTYTGSTGTVFQQANTISIGTPFIQSGGFLVGNIQELVFYRSNQSANEVNIRANMNAFHSVY